MKYKTRLIDSKIFIEDEHENLYELTNELYAELSDYQFTQQECERRIEDIRKTFINVTSNIDENQTLYRFNKKNLEELSNAFSSTFTYITEREACNILDSNKKEIEIVRELIQNQFGAPDLKVYFLKDKQVGERHIFKIFI